MTDPFDDAREAFVKMDDLEGRLLLITPTDSGERESNLKGAKAGETYTYVVADVAVLDGDVTEMIEEVPVMLDDFQFSGQAVTGQLLPKLKKGTKVLGRLSTRPNSYKTKTWVIAAPTEDDKVTARQYLASVPVPADPWEK